MDVIDKLRNHEARILELEKDMANGGGGGGGGTGVTSFNGRTGAVVPQNGDYQKAWVGLGSVDNTSDLNKPISTAQAIVNSQKANITSPAFGGIPTAPTPGTGTNNSQIATTAFVIAQIAATTTNGVISFNARTGTVVPMVGDYDKVLVGLGNVDNTSDVNKPVSSAQAATLAPKASPAFTGLPTAPNPLPNTSSNQIATTAFVMSQIATTPVAGVASFNGRTGAVTPAAGDYDKVLIGLPQVDNTSDASKPISIAQAAVNALKANLSSPTFTGTPAGPTAAAGTSTTQLATTAFVMAQIAATPTAGVASFKGRTGAVVPAVGDYSKADIGLGNVDDTSDASKPVSGPQALTLAPKNSPAFTGTPTAPTPAPASNDTSVATTAFVISKITAISAGVVSFNTRSGAVTPQNGDYTKGMVGLGSVDNTSDANKPISSAQAAVNATLAPLNSPTLVGIPAAPTALAGTATTQIATTAFVMSQITATAKVITFNGRGGVVVPQAGDYTAADVGLGNVDNTTDLAKPISTAQAAVNALKANIASPTFTGIVSAPTPPIGTATTQVATTAFVMAQISSASGVVSFNTRVGAVVAQAGDYTKAMVGLGNVDDTSDASKPVSTAQAAALALKANLASPTLTGIPAGPTAAVGTNTTQLATTAYVMAQIASSSVAGVLSFNSRTGAVLPASGDYTKADVGLANVDNTADANKPVSTPQATALAPKASPALTGIPTAPTAIPNTNTTQIATTAFVIAQIAFVASGVTTFNGRNGTVVPLAGDYTPSMVGLSNVDNTSDANKPISAAQAAVNATLAPLASPALTGVPTAPTATLGTGNTQIANTAFVLAQISGTVKVTSFNGRSGVVTSQAGDYTSAQVGLGNVDNTSDLLKPVSNAQAAINATLAPLASPALTGIPVAPTAPIGTSTTQLATTAFVMAQIGGTTRVISFNGRSGVVTSLAGDYTPAMVGLGNVDNTSDLNKPVSTAQAAINVLKANIASPTFTGIPAAPTAAVGTSTTQVATTAFVMAQIAATPASVVSFNGRTGAVLPVAGDYGKSDVGLSAVDNTADVNKPVSFAQQAALNLKADIANVKFIGTNPYQLIPADDGQILVWANAAALTLNFDTTLRAGFQCELWQDSTGQIQFIGIGGASAISRGGFIATAGQYAAATICHLASTQYRLAGDLA